MKDYKLSEVKNICKKHYRNDGCLNCPFQNKTYAFNRCKLYAEPYHWATIEKEKTEQETNG